MMLNNRHLSGGNQHESNVSQRSHRFLPHQVRNSITPSIAVAICRERETQLDRDILCQDKVAISKFAESGQLV